MVARSQGIYDDSALFFRESLGHAELIGHSGYPYARALSHLGRVLYLRGDAEQAERILTKALTVIADTRQAGNVLADCLEWLAAVACARGDVVGAARLFGAADGQWRTSGGTRYAPDSLAYEADVASVRLLLDPSHFVDDDLPARR